MSKVYHFAISKKAMAPLKDMLALEHEAHQQFNSSGKLVEGGVSIAFREDPQFLVNWTKPERADARSFEEEHGYCGGLVDIVQRGLVFAADPDPWDG